MLKSEEIRRRVLERLHEQRALVQTLLRLREQLQGSLFTRYGLCGKPGCVCRTGPKHGPYHVLSTRTEGRAGFTYLKDEKVEAARERVRSYREFRRGLRRLRRLNADIVTLLRRYQAAASKRGGRDLGLAVGA